MRKNRFIQCTIGLVLLVGGCGSPPDDAPSTESSAVNANADEASVSHTSSPENKPRHTNPETQVLVTSKENRPPETAPTDMNLAAKSLAEKPAIEKMPGLKYETGNTPVTTPVITTQQASSEGIVSRQTELKIAPRTEAGTIQLLPPTTTLDIVERQGGWYRVSVAGTEGWVRLLHIARRQSKSVSSISSELESVAGIATGRSGTGNITSTTGIRGFNEQDLSLAKPDFDQLSKIEAFVATPDQATTEANRRGLVARRIDYLKEPSR